MLADPGVTGRFSQGEAASTNYQEALLYNLLLQTSCFRYWGQGVWTEYAQELYRRGIVLGGFDGDPIDLRWLLCSPVDP
jgi:hypothetical protein